MPDSPLISVIVPVYNVEKYLNQCVDSLICQEGFDSYEILLVNDASTDQSLALARSLAEQHDKIRVVDKEHSGLGFTRNAGLKEARGEYILFVDSDDWVAPTLLATVYKAAQDAGADLVFFNYSRENELMGNSRVSPMPYTEPTMDKTMTDGLFDELIGPDYSPWRRCEMLGCAVRRFYKKSLFTDNHILFGDEQVIMLEDLPVAIEVHRLAKRIVLLPDVLYFYRYNPHSLTTNYRPHKLEKLAKCFEKVAAFWEKEGIYEPYRQRHSAWFIRMAVHSSLINCFNVGNRSASFGQRLREIKGILNHPLTRKAAKTDYFRGGSRGDRLLTLFVRLRMPLLTYLFYWFYSKSLQKKAHKL